MVPLMAEQLYHDALHLHLGKKAASFL
jgi:hypothetical protein